MTKYESKAYNVISPAQQKQEEMLPVPWSVVTSDFLSAKLYQCSIRQGAQDTKAGGTFMSIPSCMPWPPAGYF